jgi:hypothetical protein
MKPAYLLAVRKPPSETLQSVTRYIESDLKLPVNWGKTQTD